MKLKINKGTYLMLILGVTGSITCSFDVSFLGTCKFADGIGRRAIGQIQTLKDSLKVNFVNTRDYAFEEDIAPSVLEIFHHPDKSPGTVMVFLDGFYQRSLQILGERGSGYKIKFAYVTVESTKAPASWVDILNTHFDGVLVPDVWCGHSLKKSGLRIPFFVLPEICYLEDFLNEPLQKEPHYPFTFGVTATSWKYKNYDLLLDAFAAEFKNSPDVLLRLHNHGSRNAHHITDKIKDLHLKNVIDSHGPISKGDYVNHMKSIDCYVLVSKGEGFSITPREALALGRPCILANHTAHMTICNTGFVRPVEASIIEKHDSENYGGEDVGNVFNCSIKDVRKALRDVYENYQLHVDKALKGREWVKQYLAENLRARYMSMLKPKKVMLGNKNELTNDYVMTDSQALYDKFMAHIIEPEMLKASAQKAAAPVQKAPVAPEQNASLVKSSERKPTAPTQKAPVALQQNALMVKGSEWKRAAPAQKAPVAPQQKASMVRASEQKPTTIAQKAAIAEHLKAPKVAASQQKRHDEWWYNWR